MNLVVHVYYSITCYTNKINYVKKKPTFTHGVVQWSAFDGVKL